MFCFCQVHSQVKAIGEGNGTGTMQRIVSASDVFNEEPSSEKENYGQMYTIPQKRGEQKTGNVDDFGENLGNERDGAAPTGDILIDDSDDETPEMEMVTNGKYGEKYAHINHNDEDDIDDINNNLLIMEHDDEVAGDINNMITPNGDEEGTDDEFVIEDDGEMPHITPNGNDEDIDNINSEVVNDIDDMMVTQGIDLNENDIIWNGYIDKYGNEPQNASQLQQFCKSNANFKSLNYKEAKQIFNDNKEKGRIDLNDDDDIIDDIDNNIATIGHEDDDDEEDLEIDDFVETIQ